MNKNYIEQLQAILTATGWPQVKLAKELKITFAALNRWLNKRAIPHPSSKADIYQLYKELVGIQPLSRELIEKLTKELEQEKKKHKNIKEIIKDNKSLREDLLLELTYNSNAIEGSTLTKKETETIIFDHGHISDKSYIEHLEATNHASALTRIFDGEFINRPISEKTIKKLHSILMQGIRDDVGKYSKHQRAIRGVDLTLPHPEDIPFEMRRFIRQINKPGKGLSIIEHISEMHASFEAIHPFGDGNGRVGRLIMTVQLLKAGYPPCLVEQNRKAKYYETLEFAQKKSSSHLIEFVVQGILKGFAIIRKHKR